MKIPYLSLQQVTDMHADEIQSAVCSVVSSGWYLQGEHIARFEEEYANYCRASHCISCANGLDALTLILRGYKEMGIINDGDEIIVPANTYIATILSITENNLTPILVEPSLDTFEIDDSLIEQAITPRTRAIMIVHLYGFNALTERIVKICKDRGLLLLQDCAQSHGLHNCVEQPLASVRGAQAHSFYPGKNLGALGDAGAVTTNDSELAAIVRTLSNYGSNKKYVFPLLGRNSRMDEIQAAVLSVKLKYLDKDNKRRLNIAHAYINNVKNSRITLPKHDGVYHIFPVLCERRDQLQQYLHDKGIGTMIHYPIPPHQQDCYKHLLGNLSLPVTEKIHAQELSIPCNQTMTDEEVIYVVDALNSFS